MAAYVTLIVERREGVAIVKLNRPDRLNAISFAMFDELHALCADLARDPATRVVILTGEGRAFCSGIDLDEAATLPEMSTTEISAKQEYWASTVAKLRALPQPIIAAINGAAAGGGLSLALAADIRIGSPQARLNAAFIRVGLTSADLGVSWALPRVVGLGRAAELMYTGRFVEADEAREIGLLNSVVPEESLLPATLELAADIASNSPHGVRFTKRALQANVDAPSLETALELENRGQALATRTEDMVEALRAFREKRSPVFKDG